MQVPRAPACCGPRDNVSDRRSVDGPGDGSRPRISTFRDRRAAPRASNSHHAGFRERTRRWATSSRSSKAPGGSSARRSSSSWRIAWMRAVAFLGSRAISSRISIASARLRVVSDFPVFFTATCAAVAGRARSRLVPSPPRYGAGADPRTPTPLRRASARSDLRASMPPTNAGDVEALSAMRGRRPR